MNNKVKIGIAVVIIIITLVVCTLIFKKGNKANEVNTNTLGNVENIEKVPNGENFINNTTIENVVENKAEEKPVVENKKLETKDFTNSIYEDNSSVGTTDKKQEAINLVKNQWGEDDSVTFSCDSITPDGIYVIAVTSKERAVVLNYFRVDLSSKSVTIDY